MLGDAQALVESPDLTLRRLQLRHGKGSAAFHAALDQAIFPSKATRDFGGYKKFLDVVSKSTDALEEAALLESATDDHTLKAQLRHLRTLASANDNAAALLARLLMDRQVFQGLKARLLDFLS